MIINLSVATSKDRLQAILAYVPRSEHAYIHETSSCAIRSGYTEPPPYTQTGPVGPQRNSDIGQSYPTESTLDGEEALDQIRLFPRLRPARTPLLHILRVLRRNDLLARFGVVHNRVVVRGEAVEEPVEDACGDERVYVADGEPVRGGDCVS